MRDLLDFGKNSLVEGGFGSMDLEGKVDSEAQLPLFVTCRMVHVYSLGTLMGIPGCRRMVDHGVRALTEAFYDHDHGGWYDQIEPKLDQNGHGIAASKVKMA